jgi:hypothetical protein
MLNIYKLERDWDEANWEEDIGMVIAASSPYEARRTAMLHHGAESPQIWRSSLVKVTLVGTTTKWKTPHIIMTSNKGA